MEYEADQLITGIVELDRVLRDGYVLKVEGSTALQKYRSIMADVDEDNTAHVYGIHPGGDEDLIDELGRFLAAVKNTPSAKFYIMGDDEAEENEEDDAENFWEFESLKQAVDYMGEEPSGRRRITENEKYMIKQLKDYGFSSKQIAKKFGISQANASKIANPQT